jgi:hypothetical protein
VNQRFLKQTSFEDEVQKTGLCKDNIQTLNYNSLGLLHVFDFLDAWVMKHITFDRRSGVGLGLGDSRNYRGICEAINIKNFWTAYSDFGFNIPQLIVSGRGMPEEFLPRLVENDEPTAFFIPTNVFSYKHSTKSDLATQRELQWYLNHPKPDYAMAQTYFVIGLYSICDDDTKAVETLSNVFRNYRDYIE